MWGAPLSTVGLEDMNMQNACHMLPGGVPASKLNVRTYIEPHIKSDVTLHLDSQSPELSL